MFLVASSGCGGGPEEEGAVDAGRDAAPALDAATMPDAAPDSGVEPVPDAGAEPDAGDVPECQDCGSGLGFEGSSIRAELVTECYCARNTYRRDFYDALAGCFDGTCDGRDVDACYEGALASLDATPVALEAIDICEGRAEECAFQDCRFLAGFADDVLEDYLGCLYAADCGSIVPCVDFESYWCEVH